MNLPRVVIYKEDGSGRDTYISSNNGGRCNFIKNFPNKSPTFQSPFKKSLPQISPRSPKYAMDGSGRDTYCQNNADFSVKKVFVDSLRKYEKIHRSTSPKSHNPKLDKLEYLRIKEKINMESEKLKNKGNS